MSSNKNHLERHRNSFPLGQLYNQAPSQRESVYIVFLIARLDLLKNVRVAL